MASARPWWLVAAAAAWLWAHSVFTPWAEDMDPRLWLYDALFYARFTLLAWALAELGVRLLRRERRPAAYAWAGGLALLVALGWAYERTDAGLRVRILASEAALARSAALPYATPRHRAGHFLVDTVRDPVAGEPWLWLGRPFGGGTGTGRALVRSRRSAPAMPAQGAYAFRPLVGDWWLAEQR